MDSKFSIHPVGWKYRVVQELIEESEDEYPARFGFTIRQVWHDQEGNALQFSEEIIPYGESRLELQEDLLKMLNALIYPTILESDVYPRDDG